MTREAVRTGNGSNALLLRRHDHRRRHRRVFEGRTPQARVDWQAMCIQHRPDWWQCWGAHDGWGHE